MYICDILCEYAEYEKVGNSWRLKLTNTTTVDSNFIQNIVDAGYYFTSMGGTQEVSMLSNRRFGMQVSCITCISFCGSIKKVLKFNYNNAKKL